MKRLHLALAALTVACAHRPPSELQAARSMYSEVLQQSINAETRDVRNAHDALARAEILEKKRPGSETARDQAYIALRLAQLARAHDQTNVARKKIEQRVALERQQAEQAQQQKEDERLAVQAPEPTNEGEDARATTFTREPRQTSPLDALPPGAVSREERGTVITSDALRFDTARDALSDEAESVLTTVARAAKQENSRVIVEGHTDDRGSTVQNEKLAKRRAAAVDRFLIERGVEHVEMKAVGEAQPKENNTTEEGRAANRRVEIVLMPSDDEPE